MRRGSIEIIELLQSLEKVALFRKSSDRQTSTVPRTTQLRRMYTRLITRIETTCTRLGNFIFLHNLYSTAQYSDTHKDKQFKSLEEQQYK